MAMEKQYFNRRSARVASLKALYEYDATGHLPEKALDRLIQEEGLEGNGGRMARELAEGAARELVMIDSLIKKFAPAWPVHQIPLVDRNILRIAIYEMLYHKDVPHKVVINEAVELAKVFGSESSPRFVNGVLGSLLEDSDIFKETVNLKRE